MEIILPINFTFTLRAAALFPFYIVHACATSSTNLRFLASFQLLSVSQVGNKRTYTNRFDSSLEFFTTGFKEWFDFWWTFYTFQNRLFRLEQTNRIPIFEGKTTKKNFNSETYRVKCPEAFDSFCRSLVPLAVCWSYIPFVVSLSLSRNIFTLMFWYVTFFQFSDRL